MQELFHRVRPSHVLFISARLSEIFTFSIRAPCALPAPLSLNNLPKRNCVLQVRDVHPTNPLLPASVSKRRKMQTNWKGKRLCCRSWFIAGEAESELAWKPVLHVCYSIIFPPKPPPSCSRGKGGQRSPGCSHHVPGALHLSPSWKAVIQKKKKQYCDVRMDRLTPLGP